MHSSKKNNQIKQPRCKWELERARSRTREGVLGEATATLNKHFHTQLHELSRSCVRSFALLLNLFLPILSSLSPGGLFLSHVRSGLCALIAASVVVARPGCVCFRLRCQSSPSPSSWCSGAAEGIRRNRQLFRRSAPFRLYYGMMVGYVLHFFCYTFKKNHIVDISRDGKMDTQN